MQETVDMMDDPEYEEEEPSFSDPEDYVDDIEDEGECSQETRRLSGLLLSVSRSEAGANRSHPFNHSDPETLDRKTDTRVCGRRAFKYLSRNSQR